MITDAIYKDLILHIEYLGHTVITRNHAARFAFDCANALFTKTPLVTVRKTAWKMALREMEWFLSGNPRCPDILLPWWKNQLSPDGCYYRGYGEQLRSFAGKDLYDQVEFLLKGLKRNPNSRRLVATTWNPYDMEHITEINSNENCPTTCHSTLLQCATFQDQLMLISYQRSADMLLGLPHNWIQTWALLLFLAHHSQKTAKSLRWDLGNAHIYRESSHLQAVSEILNQTQDPFEKNTFELKYQPESIELDEKNIPIFKANDFIMEGIIPSPSVHVKPALLT